MADLIDRLALDESVTLRPKIPVHQFIGYFALYVLGKRTRTELKTIFDLQGSEAAQADALADAVDAKTGIENKHAYVSQVDAVALLLDIQAAEYVTDPEAGTIDKTKVQADLDI